MRAAVFVPGIMADSPIYSMLADGAKMAVNAYCDKGGKAQLTVSEAGTNQAQWLSLLTALAAQKYDVILSSNPSLPALAEQVQKDFPNQRFILLDAEAKLHNAETVRFDQKAQAYLAGFAAGKASKTGRLGLIAAQEYPVMNEVILPAFKEGAQSARKDAAVDFRVVGNWYDATKGAQLSRAMADSGVDVILPIAGGAGQGVIASAKECGFFLVLFDSADFSKERDKVIACATIDMERLSFEAVSDFLEGKTQWETSRIAGAKDGYVRIVLSDNTQIVGDDMREEVNALAARFASDAPDM